MAVVSKLHNLIELAKEKSSERRRTLLREVTDLFFDETPEANTPVQQEFDDVLSALAERTAISARKELAERFSDSPQAPRGLILKLAKDAIEIAAPILTKSKVLTEEDLLSLASSANTSQLRAISKREIVPETVSTSIVNLGSDDVIADLISNKGAKITRETFETVTAKAENSAVLQGPLIERQDTPTDLLGDLMLSVESRLREQILERFSEVDPDELEAALAVSRQRLSDRMSEGQELEKAEEFIRKKAVRKQLDGTLLARLLREREMLKFYVGFANLTGVDVVASRCAIEQECVDPLALICKSAQFDKALFVTLAVLRPSNLDNSFQDAKTLGDLYASIDPADADRALRFWRMRKDLAA